MAKNKHGLDRDIPDPVKRQVRQECGNGCIVCGRLPYQYEHFDPDFEDATAHRPERIALLCAKHHQDKTSKRLSVEAVRRARAQPFNAGRSAVWQHHLTERSLALNVGGNRLAGSTVGISINGSVVIGLRAPGTHSGQWLLTGSFVDPSGRETLRFADNELIAVSGSWDVTMEGEALTVRAGPGQIVARVEFKPNESVIVVDRLEMRLANGGSLHVDPARVVVKGPAGEIHFEGNDSSSSRRVVHVGPRGQPPGEFDTFSITRPDLGTFADWIAPG